MSETKHGYITIVNYLATNINTKRQVMQFLHIIRILGSKVFHLRSHYYTN